MICIFPLAYALQCVCLMNHYVYEPSLEFVLAAHMVKTYTTVNSLMPGAKADAQIKRKGLAPGITADWSNGSMNATTLSDTIQYIF
jgi:hypothetical protein